MFEVSSISTLIEKQQGGGTPSRNEAAFWNGDIPWASVKDFKDDQLELQATEETITSLGLRSSTSNLIPPGIPMVCTRMAVGRTAVSLTPTAINQDVRALYPKKGVSPRYLLRLISSLQGKAESLSVGSTVKGIRTSDFLAIEAHVAPEQEQGVIARILDTLDTQIHKTDALIAKLEKVKEGLLHDLLTRGIDENGQLRPSPEQAPELYKESPLGLIPREWVCERLKWFVPTIDYGISTSLSDKGEAPVLRMNNIQNGEAELSSLKFTEEHKINGLELRYGDVLFNRTNSLEHVGRTGIWREQITKAGFASYLVRLNNDKKILNEEYLNFWLNLKETKNRIKRYATPGVHQVNVNPTNLRKVYMAAPSDIKEQLRVVGILLESNHGLQKEQCLVEKLKSKKLALMDDLLTGRVRVTPLLDQAQATTPA